MEKLKHWTAASLYDLAFRIGFDFVAQLETKLETEGMDKRQFAQRAGISAGRVSQVFNTPNNLRVTSMVQYARALGMKVAIVAYEDEDPNNEKGPISPEVFAACWRRSGSPSDMFALTQPLAEAKQDLRFYRPRIRVKQATGEFGEGQNPTPIYPKSITQQQSHEIEMRSLGLKNAS